MGIKSGRDNSNAIRQLIYIVLYFIRVPDCQCIYLLFHFLIRKLMILQQSIWMNFDEIRDYKFLSSKTDSFVGDKGIVEYQFRICNNHFDLRFWQRKIGKIGSVNLELQ